MRTILIALALVLALCLSAAATNANSAWNTFASAYSFDAVTTPIATSTLLSSLYHGSNLTRDYYMILGAIGAELDDPKTNPDEPESATWNEIVNW